MAKITFTARHCVSDAVLARHRDHARSLDLSRIEGSGEGPLAVVGGGPSLPGHLDALKAWDGEIWGINGAWNWLEAHGIEAVYYRIDPNPVPMESLRGVRMAVLADTVDPDVFNAVDGIRLVRLGEDEISHGSTAACTAPIIAAHAGYSSVTLFACEGSFAAKSHSYKCERHLHGLLDVKCGDAVYETSPQMIMQTEWLAEMARSLPGYLTVAGEGFLPALVAHGDYDVVAVSRDIAKQLEAT